MSVMINFSFGKDAATVTEEHGIEEGSEGLRAHQRLSSCRLRALTSVVIYG